MLTSFGKYCRVLRMEYGELLKDMAKKLDVTSAYLSAVENGKRNIPTDWLEKVTDIYNLNDSEKENLSNAIDLSMKEITIDMAEMTNGTKELAISFARKVNTINSKKLKEIIDLLEED